MNEDALRALREAARVSPDNVPLRAHLGEVLLSSGRGEEAEAEFRTALTYAPHSERLKIGLARAFFQQGKKGEALVVIEEVVATGEAPARAYLLYSRLLLGRGDLAGADRAYRKAVDLEPGLADDDLARDLAMKRDAPVSAGPVPVAADGDLADAAPLDVEHPTLTFADVGGMESLKDEIRMKIVHPLSHPELYRAYGRKIGGGILMYGPPGCGKTFLARATAGEIKARFIAVGINDVLDMWLGNSERRLHELFEQARANAPCVLFFDEVDALAARRADMRRQATRILINQFLAEFDGVASSNEGVLILAATNAPWDVDAAFRRPGRFDRIIFVPPPDAGGRASILRLLVRGKPVEDIDFDRLARETDGFTGADLSGCVERAVEGKLRVAMREGVPKPLRTSDLSAAIAQVRPSTASWFEVADNYVRYANADGIYDDLRPYSKKR